MSCFSYQIGLWLFLTLLPAMSAMVLCMSPSVVSGNQNGKSNKLSWSYLFYYFLKYFFFLLYCFNPTSFHRNIAYSPSSMVISYLSPFCALKGKIINLHGCSPLLFNSATIWGLRRYCRVWAAHIEILWNLYLCSIS